MPSGKTGVYCFGQLLPKLGHLPFHLLGLQLLPQKTDHMVGLHHPNHTAQGVHYFLGLASLLVEPPSKGLVGAAFSYIRFRIAN